MEKISIEPTEFVRLIAAVRAGDYEEFSIVIHGAFVGSRGATEHLARYLWDVYGPSGAQDEEPEDG